MTYAFCVIQKSFKTKYDLGFNLNLERKQFKSKIIATWSSRAPWAMASFMSPFSPVSYTVETVRLIYAR